MMQVKMTKIITAIASAVTAGLVFLASYAIGSFVVICVNQNRIKTLQAEIVQLEEDLKNAENTYEYVQKEIYLQKAYQELLELENKNK
jgi:cell division protein FtsB